jgi:hypothetical protein
MPQRWFIRNTNTDLLTGRRPPRSGLPTSIGHVTEIVGHDAEFGGHDAETVGHAPPKYAHLPRVVQKQALFWLRATERFAKRDNYLSSYASELK